MSETKEFEGPDGCPWTPRIQCPFCSGVYQAVKNPTGEPAVIHSVPTCPKYDTLEPDGFLIAACGAYLAKARDKDREGGP